MFCVACGANVQDGRKFCTSCGTPVAVIPTAAPQQFQASPIAPPFTGVAPSQMPLASGTYPPPQQTFYPGSDTSTSYMQSQIPTAPSQEYSFAVPKKSGLSLDGTGGKVLKWLLLAPFKMGWMMFKLIWNTSFGWMFRIR